MRSNISTSSIFVNWTLTHWTNEIKERVSIVAAESQAYDLTCDWSSRSRHRIEPHLEGKRIRKDRKREREPTHIERGRPNNTRSKSSNKTPISCCKMKVSHKASLGAKFLFPQWSLGENNWSQWLIQATRIVQYQIEHLSSHCSWLKHTAWTSRWRSITIQFHNIYLPKMFKR